jgi:hypothetical protein
MPYISPSPGDVHVNRPLTNIAVAYMQDTSKFVADKVFPNIPVTKQSDAYFVYERGSWNRDEMKDRAPGTESAGGSYEIDNETYYARVKAFHKDVPDQLLDNVDSPLNLERDATNFVTGKALLNREVNFSRRYFKEGVWTFNVDGVAANPTAPADFQPKGDGSQGNNDVLVWSDPASTPIEDGRAAMTRVQLETGFRPNKVLLSRPVYDKLVDHPDVVARLDRGQTTGPAKANRESLAALWEIDEVVVMEAIMNSATQGNVEANVFIAGNHALFLYVASEPGLLVPSAGYTFSWTGRSGNSQMGFRIKRFRIERLEVTRVEGQQAYDQKLVGTDLGYFFADIIAPTA